MRMGMRHADGTRDYRTNSGGAFVPSTSSVVAVVWMIVLFVNFYVLQDELSGRWGVIHSVHREICRHKLPSTFTPGRSAELSARF